MKKLFNLFIILLIMISTILPMSVSIARNFNGNSPVDIVDEVQAQANKRRSDRVQNTEYDSVSSKPDRCAELAVDSRFTITRTLCNLKAASRDYLQYVVYIGLTVATILIIRNGFKIVTADDREKQIGVFKKNMLYIIIGVSLLIGFYYVIDIFVSVVNLISE